MRRILLVLGAAAALLLGRCAPADDIEKLFADLTSGDLEVRQEAADRIDALVQQGRYEVFARGLKSANPSVRAQAMVQLARMPVPGARQSLRELLARDRRMMLPYNPIRLKPMRELNDSRILAANLIRRGGGDPEAIDVLLHGAEENATPEETVGTCLAIGALLDPKGIPFLDKAAKHPDIEVARAATQALGQFKEPEALAALRRLSAHPAPEVRADVVSALSSRDGKEVEEILKTVAAGDPSPDLRAAALQGLGRFKDPDLVPWLIARLKDAPPEVRPAVAQALNQVTGQSLGPSPESWQRWYARAGGAAAAAR
jgi:HEAT repeat protein